MKIEKQWENNRSKMISNIVFGAYLLLTDMACAV